MIKPVFHIETSLVIIFFGRILSFVYLIFDLYIWETFSGQPTVFSAVSKENKFVRSLKWLTYTVLKSKISLLCSTAVPGNYCIGNVRNLSQKCGQWSQPITKVILLVGDKT